MLLKVRFPQNNLCLSWSSIFRAGSCFVRFYILLYFPSFPLLETENCKICINFHSWDIWQKYKSWSLIYSIKHGCPDAFPWIVKNEGGNKCPDAFPKIEVNEAVSSGNKIITIKACEWLGETDWVITSVREANHRTPPRPWASSSYSCPSRYLDIIFACHYWTSSSLSCPSRWLKIIFACHHCRLS